MFGFRFHVLDHSFESQKWVSNELSINGPKFMGDLKLRGWIEKFLLQKNLHFLHSSVTLRRKVFFDQDKFI